MSAVSDISFDSSDANDGAPQTSPQKPTRVVPNLSEKIDWARVGLTPSWIEPFNALIITKTRSGFTDQCVIALRRLIAAIARGDLAGLKYFVLDFAHTDATAGDIPKGLDDLVAAQGELVLEAPIITVAFARSFLTGADLDFAMYCSVLLAQEDARFSFDGDPMELFGLYAALARKIGFAKAERLFEDGATLSAEEMRELLLVKEVVGRGAGLEPIETTLRSMARRFNASQAIFRAQRVAMPPLTGRSDAPIGS